MKVPGSCDAGGDCDDHLARRLTRDGQPLISSEIRHTITEHSHGLPLYLDLSVMRFLEIRRSGRAPQPSDFDHDFPALVARTLSDLTPDERHVLRSVALLDAFDLDLATAVVGLPHQAPALRLTERPFVRENAFGLWPYHLHGLIRTTVRTRPTTAGQTRTGARPRHAPCTPWATNGSLAPTVTGSCSNCLRQGLSLAQDHALDLGWLADAAFAYISDSVWEPVAPLADSGPALSTPADALAELLSALTRRQREHRSRTVAPLTTVIDTRLLPGDLHEMALYYRAKALRDTGRAREARAVPAGRRRQRPPRPRRPPGTGPRGPPGRRLPHRLHPRPDPRLG
ncbi:hypothetical protein ACTU45_31815, partial [Streptomyces sp. 24-1644]